MIVSMIIDAMLYML